MKVQITQNDIPKRSDLVGALWVKEDGRAYVPTRMFSDGRWYLVDISDPANGYKRAGDGWLTITDMFEMVRSQFKYLIPVETATITTSESDVINL